METRNYDIGGETIAEHKHEGYDYWHPATRVHAELGYQLPAGHVLSKKPLAEKLILDRVEVTPIQMMELGKSLEIGAVQSLMEGLQHHRYAASVPIQTDHKNDGLFYAVWKPNHSSKLHRYLIEVSGENVYVGYFPNQYEGGLLPRMYGIYHKKQDVIKFLHRTHNSNLMIPELSLLTELSIPNITFKIDEDKDGSGFHTTIRYKQGDFFTRSIYGEFTPLSECNFIPDPDSGNTPETVMGHWEEPEDSTGYNIGNPRHPYYMFQGATGYIQLFEGKMFCYPNGSIRFLTKEQEKNIFRCYTDLQIVQGDLVAYELEGHTVPEPQPVGVGETNIDRHNLKAYVVPALQIDSDNVNIHTQPLLLQYDNLGGVYIAEDCNIEVSHPEHGNVIYQATKGKMLALLPGTSRPFAKDNRRD